MKISKPKTIIEAIEELEEFLDSDLYTKFRPQVKFPVKNESWYRQDFFKSEKEFREYLETHFKILKKQVKRLESK
jgi:hypothetical protein